MSSETRSKPRDWHRATDRRCYDGACCSDLQRELDSVDELVKELQALGGSVCYFPAGGHWMAFKGYRLLNELEYSEKGDACVAGIEILEQESEA